MRVLIIGASGQLGSALRHTFADHTLLTPSHRELDMSQPQAIKAVRELAPDVVLLPGAYTNVDGCALDPERAFRENTLGPKYVALACARRDVPLVYVSTNEVFSGVATTPYREYDQPGPINAYGRSKWGGEQAVLQHAPTAMVARVAWLFGGQRNFIRTILRLASQQADTGQPLRVVDDEVGSPTYTPDAALAIRQLVDAGIPGIYHLVNAGHCSRYALACAALQSAAIDAPIEPITSAHFSRPSTPPAYTPLINSAAAALGITLRPWQSAVEEYSGMLALERTA
ncbi:MAG: dTDP-4-dehydrorhamnose reductase [Herpetosiphonaceae bacterium]|nr:dTDP-4-dehydrorhamnose reductase [Herpetosiphonaceae bacterium]